MKKRLVFSYVLDPMGKILLLHRSDRDEREPVKGGVSSGESFEDAAWRELKEETGLSRADISSHIQIPLRISIPDDRFERKQYLFLTKLLQPTITINFDPYEEVDHDDRCWIQCYQLCDYPLYNQNNLHNEFWELIYQLFNEIR